MRVLIISGSRALLPDPVYPLGAAIIATAVEGAGHQVTWFDALRHKEAVFALGEVVDEWEPQAILFSIRNIDSAAFPGVDRHFEEHRELARICRERSTAPIVLGGSGFSLLPQAFMSYLNADFGVCGEGEQRIVELLEQINAGTTDEPVITTPRAAPPFLTANRELFDAPWYYQRGGVANLQTKRGCALNCIYCTYPLLEGHKVRRVDPRAVVEEMVALKRAGIEHFFIVDAVFNRPEEHAAAICEEICRQELDISFSGFFIPQGDLAEFPSLLVRAGCTAVELGTDSLSDPVLHAMRKGFTVDDAMGYCRRLTEAGIIQCHNLIFGGPTETEQTMAESVARMDELAPKAMIATIGLRTYPHTELWRLGGGDDPSKIDPPRLLEPTFYIEEAVADGVIERVGEWVDQRPGWVCPGLAKRYNPRYFARLRRRYKGVLWTLF